MCILFLDILIYSWYRERLEDWNFLFLFVYSFSLFNYKEIYANNEQILNLDFKDLKK